MNDPVVEDEARNDRERTAYAALMEQAHALAVTEYESGELDDWIQDKTDDHDAFKLAHAVLQWNEAMQAIPTDISLNEYNLQQIGLGTKLLAQLPACSVVDFRATIEHVIEKKALMILEDL